MHPDFDIIVSGLGPAGSAAAYRLAQKGYRVLALEKCALPRPKVCAGGITARVIPLLDGVDTSDLFQCGMTRGLVRFKNRHYMNMDFGEPVVYGVDRAVFDHRLALRAKSAGVEIHDNEPVKGIRETSRGITVITPEAAYFTRFLVGADGANGFTARFLNGGQHPRQFAVETFVPDSYEAIRNNGDRMSIFYGDFPEGYAWIFPKKGGASVGLGVGWRHTGRIRKYFGNFLESVHLPAGLAEKCRGCPLPSYSWFDRSLLFRRNILLAGDAARLVDPITGEGIYFAIKSGEAAALAIDETFRRPGLGLRHYKKNLKADVLNYLFIAWCFKFPAYRFPGLSYYAARSNPNIEKLYVDMLQGKIHYMTLLRESRHTFRYMLKSLIRS